MKSGCGYNLATFCLAIGLTWFIQRRPKKYLQAKMLELLEEMYKRDWASHD